MLKQQLESIATQVENSFSVPEYLKVRIRYVEEKEDADIWVTPNHSLSDYIVLGSYALLNSLTKRKTEITVYNESFSKLSTVKLWWNAKKSKQIFIEADLLLQIVEPINTIYDKLYKKEDKFAMVGLGLVTALMPQLAGENLLPSELMQKIYMHDFTDTITAQKNVFEFLKTYMGLTKAGIYQELEGL